MSILNLNNNSKIADLLWKMRIADHAVQMESAQRRALANERLVKLTQNLAFGINNGSEFEGGGAYFGEVDGMGVDVGNEHKHFHNQEKSALEKVLTAGALAAAIATPIGGLMALPSILDRLGPEKPAAVAPIEIDDQNDVFELRLHPEQ